MLKNLNEYHDPRYEKISFYVIRTALILVLAGAVMYWVFGKAGNILRLASPTSSAPWCRSVKMGYSGT